MTVPTCEPIRFNKCTSKRGDKKKSLKNNLMLAHKQVKPIIKKTKNTSSESRLPRFDWHVCKTSTFLSRQEEDKSEARQTDRRRTLVMTSEKQPKQLVSFSGLSYEETTLPDPPFANCHARLSVRICVHQEYLSLSRCVCCLCGSFLRPQSCILGSILVVMGRAKTT